MAIFSTFKEYFYFVNSNTVFIYLLFADFGKVPVRFGIDPIIL